MAIPASNFTMMLVALWQADLIRQPLRTPAKGRWGAQKLRIRALIHAHSSYVKDAIVR